MRFFKDDMLVELPVRWVFTDPNAQWVGFANIFNSRNWYLGEDESWPDLGEVQGASRVWVDGSGLCHSSLGPFGSDDQWQDGALLADALTEDPCRGPVVQPFGDNNVAIEEFFVTLNVVRFSPDIWAAQSAFSFGQWYTLTRNALGPGCCFASQADFDITDGPPAFNSLGLGPFAPNMDVSTCQSIHYGPGIPGGDIIVDSN